MRGDEARRRQVQNKLNPCRKDGHVAKASHPVDGPILATPSMGEPESPCGQAGTDQGP